MLFLCPVCLLGLSLHCPFCCYLCLGTLGPMASAYISASDHLPYPQPSAQREDWGGARLWAGLGAFSRWG